MNENDKDLLSGIGAAEGDDAVSDINDVLITGLFADAPAADTAADDDADDGAAAPRQNGATAPRQNGATVPRQGGATAPRQGGATAPRQNGATAPRQGDATAPRQGGATAPRQNGATAPRQGDATAPRQGGATAPRQNGAAAPRQNGATAPRTDARYNMSPAEIRTLAAAAENAVASGRYGAALDSVFFTAGKARMALRDIINIRVPIGSRAEDLPGIAAAALITCYLQSETIDGDAIEEQLRLIIESSEDETGARPSEDQVGLRVFECVLILCVQAEQSGKHPQLKERLYRNEDSFLRTFLDRNFTSVMADHRSAVETFFNSVKLQSEEVKEIFESYLAQFSRENGFIRKFFAESRPVMITSIVCGVLFLISVIFHFVSYGNLMSFVATDDFIMTLVIILEVLFCGALLGTAWLIYLAGENKNSEK